MRAFALLALASAASAVPLTKSSNAVRHSIEVEVHAAAAESVAVSNALAAFGETFSQGSAVEHEIVSDRRRLQATATALRVSYVIACGSSCDAVNDALTTLSTDPAAGAAHATMLISAINAAAASSGIAGGVVGIAPS